MSNVRVAAFARSYTRFGHGKDMSQSYPPCLCERHFSLIAHWRIRPGSLALSPFNSVSGIHCGTGDRTDIRRNPVEFFGKAALRKLMFSKLRPDNRLRP